MVLVLAADMVRGVLHASRVRRARPQWTIQVYSPRRAWPFSKWAVLAVTWHLAPEDAPTGTAEELARDLHTWPAGQDYPWRRPLGRPASGTRGRGAQPRGNPPAAPRQEGTPLPADKHGSGRPTRLRVTMGRREGATAAVPLGPPVVVSAHGHPVPCHSSRQGGFPAAAPPWRGPAPQPAAGGGLGTVERRGRAPEPLFPPGPGPGATPRRGHGDLGMGGDGARHGVQVDHCGRSTAHAIAAGVPPPPTGRPFLGPPTRPYEGRMEGHAEPHQGVANEPGYLVPAGAGARTAHGPHTQGPPRPAQGVGSHEAGQRRDARPGAGAAAGALPADPHPSRWHVQPPGPPGFAAPRQRRAPERRGGTVANAPQPVRRARPLVPTPTPLPAPEHRQQIP